MEQTVQQAGQAQKRADKIRLRLREQAQQEAAQAAEPLLKQTERLILLTADHQQPAVRKHLGKGAIRNKATQTQTQAGRTHDRKAATRTRIINREIQTPEHTLDHREATTVQTAVHTTEALRGVPHQETGLTRGHLAEVAHHQATAPTKRVRQATLHQGAGHTPGHLAEAVLRQAAVRTKAVRQAHQAEVHQEAHTAAAPQAQEVHRAALAEALRMALRTAHHVDADNNYS